MTTQQRPTRPKPLPLIGRVVLLVVLLFGQNGSYAGTGEGGMRALLASSRTAVQATVQAVAPLLAGSELSAWDGSTNAQESEVQQRLADAGGHLSGLLEHVDALRAMVQEHAVPEARYPLEDDLAIVARDIAEFLDLRPAALESHAAHLAHAGGCRHGNPHLLRLVELVQDIRATLGAVEATMDLHGMNDQ